MRLIEHYAGFIIAFADGEAEYFVKFKPISSKLAFKGTMLAPYHNFDIFCILPLSEEYSYFVPQLSTAHQRAWFTTAPAARAAITRYLNNNNHGRN